LLRSDLAALNDWAVTVEAMFHDVPYLVGSALTRSDYRDVDVRIILDDEPYDVLAGLVSMARLNQAVSLWGQKATGLPIEFAVQPQRIANTMTGRRHPLLGWPQNSTGAVAR
jgi:hypothetical protein